MASREVEIEQNTSELKHLRFLKQIAVKFLVVLSNVYDFAKKNSGVVLETIIVSVEKVVVFFVRPAVLKDLAEQILLFVDNKFEKFAPGLAKNLIAIFQSLVDKTIAVVEKLLTTAQPLIGGIPLVGDLAQALITNPKDIADSIAKDNPVLGAVNSAAQNLVKEAQATGLKAALKSAYLSFNVVGLPVIADFCYKAKKKYPLIRCLGKVFLPVVEKLSERYNKFVKYMVGEGYELFDYLPLIPINEMKAAYKVVKVANDGLAALGDLKDGLTGLASGGLSAVGDVAEGLTGLASGGLSAVGDVASGLAGLASGGLSSVGDLAGGLPGLAGGLPGLAGAGSSTAGDVAENVADAVGDVASGLAGLASGGLSSVGDLAGGLPSLVGGGSSTAGDVADAVGDVASGLAGLASGDLSSVGDLAGGLPSLAGGGPSTAGDVAKNVADAVGDVASGLAGLASGGLSSVGDLAGGGSSTAGDVAENVADVVGDVASGLAGLASGGLSTVGDLAGGLPGLAGGGSSTTGNQVHLPGVGDLAGGLTGLAGGFMGLNKKK